MHRWLFGDVERFSALPRIDEAIADGDLLYREGNTCRPARALLKRAEWSCEDLVWAFVGAFLGMALESSPNGEAEPIGVAGTGVFEVFSRYSSRDFEVGELLGPAVGLDLRLESQMVCRVTQNAMAVGRVRRRACGKLPTIALDLRSTILTGGVVGRHAPL